MTPPLGLAEPGLGDVPLLLGLLGVVEELDGGVAPLLELPEQRELSGNCSHKIFLAAPESLIFEGPLLLLPLLLLDWATATLLVTAPVNAIRAVPMRVRYFIFISPTHTSMKIFRSLNQRIGL